MVGSLPVAGWGGSRAVQLALAWLAGLGVALRRSAVEGALARRLVEGCAGDHLLRQLATRRCCRGGLLRPRVRVRVLVKGELR